MGTLKIGVRDRESWLKSPTEREPWRCLRSHQWMGTLKIGARDLELWIRVLLKGNLEDAFQVTNEWEPWRLVPVTWNPDLESYWKGTLKMLRVSVPSYRWMGTLKIGVRDRELWLRVLLKGNLEDAYHWMGTLKVGARLREPWIRVLLKGNLQDAYHWMGTMKMGAHDREPCIKVPQKGNPEVGYHWSLKGNPPWIYV